MPVPARDGSWVVDGWAASRYEPGTVACRHLEATIAAGHVLHARLASLVRERPARLGERADRYARAERIAFGEVAGPALAGDLAELVDRAREAIDPEAGPGPDQLVHADLAGNLLLDANGAPVVIDFAPAWRPVLWADAVCVLDSVLWHEADRKVLEQWAYGPARAAMLRAVVFRVLSDDPADVAAYAGVLERLAVPV
jgi:Ser/Thr protein kinase RdoA (MazF antagonist)